MSQAAFVPPMLARLTADPPEADGWVHERKLDGLRCIAVRAGSRIELWSRSRQSFTGRFGESSPRWPSDRSTKSSSTGRSSAWNVTAPASPCCNVRVRRVDHVEGDPVALLAEACAAGWEGLIAKRATGPYGPVAPPTGSN